MPVMGPVLPRLLVTDLDVPEPMEVDDSAEDEGNHDSANGDGNLEDFAEQAFSASEDEDDHTGYSADDEWGIEDEDDLAILIVPMSALRRAMKAA